MNIRLLTVMSCFGIIALSPAATKAQITLLKDYENKHSEAIGPYRSINFREGGFSALYPIPGTDGKEFWTCSDRGVNIDCANANPGACHPTYDKMYAFPSYVPKIHRIRVQGDSVQILRTITIKRPNGTGVSGIINPTGLGSTVGEVASTDTVQDCANFLLKTTDKDTFGIDPEGLIVDKNGYFWLSEEGGPTVWKLDQNGKLIQRYTPYANMGGAQAVDVAIDTVFKYRKNNRGFEGIAITPNGKLYAIIQSPVLYPTKSVGENTRVHRIIEIDPSNNSYRMFAYLNDGMIGTGSNQIRLRDWKIGDMAAINDTTFLVIEAGLRGTSDVKKVYKININGATVVHSGLYNGKTLEQLVDSAGLAVENIVAVKKTLVLDLLANNWPPMLDKSEGLAILNDSTIAVCNDNDFGQSSPGEDGIPVANNANCHVFVYGLQGLNKLKNYDFVATEQNIGKTGVSTAQPPYLLPTTPGLSFTSIATAGEKFGSYTMVGVPDGLGAMDNNNGTFTLFMNHELGKRIGIERAHGSKGALVSRWVINKSDLSVASVEDQIKMVSIWNKNTLSYRAINAFSPDTLAAFDRFCSADLPHVSAFYNYATGMGTQERMFMNGEETSPEGRALAHIVTGPNNGHTYELPRLGKLSWENSLANAASGDKTVVACMDDATPGQVYFYIGTKTNTGNEIEKAGLTNGKLYGPVVTGLLIESDGSLPAANTSFTMADLGNVENMTGNALQTASNTAGIAQFARPEDGAWDPSNPADFYFVTTNAINKPSRLWKMHFSDINDFTQGGTISNILDGTEGQLMLDNMTVDNTGHIIMTEDVGNNAHLGRVWQYTIATQNLKQIAVHDSTLFKTGAANFLTQDEEASGVIDVQHILGSGMFLIVDQDHHSNGVPTEVAEGGQLMAFYNPDTHNANPEMSLSGNNTSIDNGDMTPVTSDNTDFGNINKGKSATKEFVIKNAGPGALTVTGINIMGAHATDFSLTGTLTFPLTIAANDTQKISIEFKPADTGMRTAMFDVHNNDFNENRYAIAIQGKGVEPKINVKGNGANIFDGDLTAGTANNTDFGSVILSGTVTKNFDIQNAGSGALTVSGINFSGTNATEFTLSTATFPMTIAAGATNAVTVQFAPTAEGVRSAILNILSDGANIATYDFAVQGTGIKTTGIDQVTFGSLVSLFPNPTGDAATISFTLTRDENVTLNVYDIAGKEVLPVVVKNAKAGTQKVNLNTSGLNNGIYFVKLSASTGNSVKMKMVIMH